MSPFLSPLLYSISPRCTSFQQSSYLPISMQNAFVNDTDSGPDTKGKNLALSWSWPRLTCAGISQLKLCVNTHKLHIWLHHQVSRAIEKGLLNQWIVLCFPVNNGMFDDGGGQQVSREGKGGMSYWVCARVLVTEPQVIGDTAGGSRLDPTLISEIA